MEITFSAALNPSPSLSKILNPRYPTIIIRNIKVVVLYFHLLNFIGFSINLYVSQASNIESKMDANLIFVEGVSPSKIRAKDNIGQCHKYKGKLINPKLIKTRCESNSLFTKAKGPALISIAVPITGINAHQPGKLYSFLI